MKRMKKCPKCFAYTLKDSCEKCKIKAEQAGYKFKVKYSQ
jgi:rRNA maturation protein Nop10